MPNGNIVSSSYDGTIKIWDSEKGQLMTTLNGHEDGVVCIDVCDEK